MSVLFGNSYRATSASRAVRCNRHHVRTINSPLFCNNTCISCLQSCLHTACKTEARSLDLEALDCTRSHNVDDAVIGCRSGRVQLFLGSILSAATVHLSVPDVSLAESAAVSGPMQDVSELVVFQREQIEKLINDEFSERVHQLSNKDLAILFEKLLFSEGRDIPDLLLDPPPSAAEVAASSSATPTISISTTSLSSPQQPQPREASAELESDATSNLLSGFLTQQLDSASFPRDSTSSFLSSFLLGSKPNAESSSLPPGAGTIASTNNNNDSGRVVTGRGGFVNAGGLAIPSGSWAAKADAAGNAFQERAAQFADEASSAVLERATALASEAGSAVYKRAGELASEAGSAVIEKARELASEAGNAVLDSAKGLAKSASQATWDAVVSAQQNQFRSGEIAGQSGQNIDQRPAAAGFSLPQLSALPPPLLLQPNTTSAATQGSTLSNPDAQIASQSKSEVSSSLSPDSSTNSVAPSQPSATTSGKDADKFMQAKPLDQPPAGKGITPPSSSPLSPIVESAGIQASIPGNTQDRSPGLPGQVLAGVQGAIVGLQEAAAGAPLGAVGGAVMTVQGAIMGLQDAVGEVQGAVAAVNDMLTDPDKQGQAGKVMTGVGFLVAVAGGYILIDTVAPAESPEQEQQDRGSKAAGEGSSNQSIAGIAAQGSSEQGTAAVRSDESRPAVIGLGLSRGKIDNSSSPHPGEQIASLPGLGAAEQLAATAHTTPSASTAQESLSSLQLGGVQNSNMNPANTPAAMAATAVASEETVSERASADRTTNERASIASIGASSISQSPITWQANTYVAPPSCNLAATSGCSSPAVPGTITTAAAPSANNVPVLQSSRPAAVPQLLSSIFSSLQRRLLRVVTMLGSNNTAAAADSSANSASASMVNKHTSAPGPLPKAGRATDSAPAVGRSNKESGIKGGGTVDTGQGAVSAVGLAKGVSKHRPGLLDNVQVEVRATGAGTPGAKQFGDSSMVAQGTGDILWDRDSNALPAGPDSAAVLPVPFMLTALDVAAGSAGFVAQNAASSLSQSASSGVSTSVQGNGSSQDPMVLWERQDQDALQPPWAALPGAAATQLPPSDASLLTAMAAAGVPPLPGVNFAVAGGRVLPAGDSIGFGVGGFGGGFGGQAVSSGLVLWQRDEEDKGASPSEASPAGAVLWQKDDDGAAAAMVAAGGLVLAAGQAAAVDATPRPAQVPGGVVLWKRDNEPVDATAGLSDGTVLWERDGDAAGRQLLPLGADSASAAGSWRGSSELLGSAPDISMAGERGSSNSSVHHGSGASGDSSRSNSSSGGGNGSGTGSGGGMAAAPMAPVLRYRSRRPHGMTSGTSGSRSLSMVLDNVVAAATGESVASGPAVRRWRDARGMGMGAWSEAQELMQEQGGVGSSGGHGACGPAGEAQSGSSRLSDWSGIEYITQGFVSGRVGVDPWGIDRGQQRDRRFAFPQGQQEGSSHLDGPSVGAEGENKMGVELLDVIYPSRGWLNSPGTSGQSPWEARGLSKDA